MAAELRSKIEMEGQYQGKRGFRYVKDDGATLGRSGFKKFCCLHTRAASLASPPFPLACSIRLETWLHITE